MRTWVLLVAILVLTPAVARAQSPDAAEPQARSVSDNYGAIAYGRGSGRWGYSFDYSSQYEAERAAIRNCGSSDCTVVVWFVNACGALAKSPRGHIGWAWANSREEAESLARSYCYDQSNGTYTCDIVCWACTTR